ncbi:MAG: hypothetical protein K0S01_566 [Herbinix sp.]|nr:hypothetical protein [Herbinix sp.]
MFLIPLLSLFLIIWFVFHIINNSHYNSHYNLPNQYNNSGNSGYSLDRSLEILRERYAKGEINEEEYLKIKRNLEH